MQEKCQRQDAEPVINLPAWLLPASSQTAADSRAADREKSKEDRKAHSDSVLQVYCLSGPQHRGYVIPL